MFMEAAIMTRQLPGPVHVAVVGAGEWGKNHVRMFARLTDAQLVSVCDLDQGRLKHVRTQHRGGGTTTQYDDI